MMIAPKGIIMAPLFILLILLLLVGLIILIIKKPKVLLPFLIVGLILIAVMFFGYSVKVPDARHSQPSASVVVQSPDTAAAAPVSFPDIWKTGIETEFEVADYTSIEAAAAGLAKKIALEGYLNDAIKNNGPGEVKFLTDIQVCGEINTGIADNMTVLEAAADSFRKYAAPSIDSEQAPGIVSGVEPVKVTVSPAIPANPLWGAKNGAVLVKITARINNSNEIDNALTRHGILSMQVQANSYQLDNSAAFSEANWLVKPENFARRIHPNNTWLIGYSQTACSDPAEARSQAIDDAALRIAKNFGSDITFDKSDISRLSLIKDTYTQKLRGSQGDIYRTAVLISGQTSVISNNLTALRNSHTQQVTTEQVHRQNSILSGWASIAILVAAIFLSYFLLDFVTKGYYKGRLVLVLIALAVLGIIAIVFISRQRAGIMAYNNHTVNHSVYGQVDENNMPFKLTIGQFV